jgi:hypothetical protein
MFENAKIEISIANWIKLFSVLVSALVFVISGYYFILNEIDGAKNSPATPIEYKMKDEQIRYMLEVLERDIGKIENRVLELERNR